MRQAWLDRLPVAAWLLRLSLGQSARISLPVIVVVTLSLGVVDSLGYLHGILFALSTFLIIIAVPMAVASLHLFERQGALDLLRIAGTRHGAWLPGIALALVLPPLGAGFVFLVANLAIRSVPPIQIAALLSVAGAAACLALIVSVLPARMRTWAGIMAMAVTIIAGAIAAVATVEVDALEWYQRFQDLRIWPMVVAAETAIGAVLVSLVVKRLSHPPRAQGAAPPRRWISGPWLFDLSPMFARSTTHSVHGAMLVLAWSLPLIIAIALFWPDHLRWRLQMASAVTLVPIVVAIIVAVNQSWLEAESGRFLLLRGVPSSPGRSAVWSIAGWIVPFAAAYLAAILAVRLLLGSWPAITLADWPIHPPIAFVVLAMVPAAVAAESWISRTTTHAIGVASAFPVIAIAWAAQLSVQDFAVAIALTAWIPWATAVAVCLQPNRPRLTPWISAAATAGASFVGLSQFFVPSSDFQSHAAFMASGFMLATPLLDGDGRGRHILGCAVLTILVGAAMISTRSLPVAPGLAALALLPISLWAGHRAERWPGDVPSKIRGMYCYLLIGGAVIGQGFFPGRDTMPTAQLMMSVYTTTAVLLVVVAVATEVIRTLVDPRRRIARPAGASS